MNTDSLTLFRGQDRLTVKPRKHGGFDLVTSGGPNVSQEEFDQIATFVAERDGADTFLGKLRARMER